MKNVKNYSKCVRGMDAQHECFLVLVNENLLRLFKKRKKKKENKFKNLTPWDVIIVTTVYCLKARTHISHIFNVIKKMHCTFNRCVLQITNNCQIILSVC